MTESVLLARLEFFGSEAKDERGGGETVRHGKRTILVWGSFFEYYICFKGRIEFCI